MSAPFPLPNNLTGIANMGEYANTLTNNLWGVGILLAGVTIMFIVLSQRYSTRTTIGTTGIMLSVLSILWRFAGQISDSIMFTCVMVGMAGILYLYFVKEEFVE